MDETKPIIRFRQDEPEPNEKRRLLWTIVFSITVALGIGMVWEFDFAWKLHKGAAEKESVAVAGVEPVSRCLP